MVGNIFEKVTKGQKTRNEEATNKKTVIVTMPCLCLCAVSLWFLFHFESEA